MAHYIFTITFKSMNINRKLKLIQELPIHFALGIGPYDITNSKIEAQLYYTIEYHKKKYGDKGNNVTRPHLHGILKTNKYIGMGRQKTLFDYLSNHFGRTQLYLEEDQEELEGWWEYCSKDVNKNNEDYGIQHGHEAIPVTLQIVDIEDISSDEDL